MKFRIQSLIIAVTLLSINTKADVWNKKADFVDGRSGAISFAIGNKIYVGGGSNASGQRKDFWEYNTQTDLWTQKSDLDSVSPVAGFAIGDAGYAVKAYGSFYKYDTTANTWAPKTNFPGIPRYSPVAFVINNKAYYGTGSFAANLYNDWWEYEPTADIWTQKANFPDTARADASAFSIGNYGYLCGGRWSSPVYFNSLWEYHPTSDTWIQKTSFPALPGTKRNHAVGFSIGAKGYYGAGINGSYRFSDFWEYDQSTDSWNQLGNVPGNYRSSAIGVAVNGKGYVGFGYGGYVATPLSDWYEFDPSYLSSWSRKASLPFTRARKSAVAFSIGSKGYIGTGNNGTQANDFWEWDASTNVWTQKADYGGGYRDIAAGFAIGNKGYIGSGWDDLLYFRSDWWEYDPASNTWTQKASWGGRFEAVAFAIGNKGYFGTGHNNDYDTTYKDFVEYDPSSNSWNPKSDFFSARYLAIGLGIGNKGYLGTGSIDSVGMNDFWEWDPSTNIWTQKATFPGTPRLEASAFSIGNYGYVGIGTSLVSKGSLYDFWEYNSLSNTWSQIDNFLGGSREIAAAFPIGNKGYVGTGCNNDLHFENDLWEYTPPWSIGIQETSAPISLQLSYLPEENEVILKGTKEQGMINIFDLSGKKIKKVSTVNDETKINIENLKAGIYLVQYLEKGKATSIKMIKY